MMQIAANSSALPASERRGANPLFAGRRKRLWALVAACAAAYGVIIQREAAVRTLPQLAPVFRAAGLPVNPLGADFRSVRAWIETQGSEQNLIIEGEILNLRRSANSAPDIRLSLVDGNGEVLYSWVAPLPGRSMKAGEKLTFRTHLAAPPAANRKVIVTFVS